MESRRKTFGAALWLMAVSTSWVAAEEEVRPRDGLAPVTTKLETLIRQVMKDQDLPAISIALVEGRNVTWAKGFGLARPKEGVAATADTVYRVGSVSKLFTDLALMQLVEQGLVDLDAPVSRYLPDFTPGNRFGTPITLRQMMTHRSGLVREPPVGHYFDPTSPSIVDTVRSLNATELVYPPTTRTKYSNAAITVVGRVVEVVRKEAFAESLKRTVIEPMGLTSTSFGTSPAIEKATARGVMWTYDGRVFDAPTFPLGTEPAGNLRSSVVDLGRMMSVLFDGGKGAGGAIVKPETLQAMWTEQFPGAASTRSFGLGFTLERFEGHERIGHGGAIYGFATDLSALPDAKIGVAVVVTKDCANATAKRISDAALRLLLALGKGEPLPEIDAGGPLEAGLAGRVAGRYGEGDSAVELVARGDRLFLTQAIGGLRTEIRAGKDGMREDGPLDFGTRLTVRDDTVTFEKITAKKVEDRKPATPPSRWDGLIGEYGWDHNTLYIHERDGRLQALIEWFYLDPLIEESPDVFRFPKRGLYDGESIVFTRDASGRATRAVAAGVTFERRKIDGDDGSTFRINPVRPVAALRTEALAATPPVERGEFLAPDLVDLTGLDPAIKLDVRYATTNNFLGTPVYSSARAFMQRPAAEALAKAHRSLRDRGFGLLIHDAYRPWYVTRIFWDATPESNHGFVADPTKGSKHNRGCAVDLSLYELESGRPVEMVGGYDEFSTRSNPDYPGGTSLQRWHREVLRKAMEDQGFAVNEVEWWHFDYRDWPKYPITNVPFEKVTAGKPSAAPIPASASSHRSSARTEVE
ncbi:MAG: serine hydrolase [Paludisphaera borealis]|uniref:serine hydrolase n=1 Tax=Paludisphaera borealis TaxID=1387353 RepID=UPI00283FD283|nr:serine hydrolase [Paludisphaera borealis]MDR3623365.1 serine hydrolase [Paludisphaera borealis]